MWFNLLNLSQRLVIELKMIQALSIIRINEAINNLLRAL